MSGFLLDTNIPSETVRARPEPQVIQWLYAQPASSLFLSVISVGELRRGFELLPSADARRRRLEGWFHHDLLPGFGERILPVTRDIAERWGALEASCRLRGIGLNAADGLIAATALEHDLTVATRNTRDFAVLGVRLFNPWGSI